MTKTINLFKWSSLVAATVACVFFGFLVFSGGVDVAVNGQQVDGYKKVVIGLFGFFIIGVATLVALGISALAVSGISLVLFSILAFVAFVLVLLAFPLLFPALISVGVISLIFILCRTRKINQKSSQAS